MAKSKDVAIDYGQLSQELEMLIAGLQGDELDVDTAVQNYKRGLEIVQQLEAYLKNTKNSVVELKSAFGPADKG